MDFPQFLLLQVSILKYKDVVSSIAFGQYGREGYFGLLLRLYLCLFFIYFYQKIARLLCGSKVEGSA